VESNSNQECRNFVQGETAVSKTKKNCTLFMLAASLCLTSCTTPKLIEYEDEFTGKKTAVIVGNRLAGTNSISNLNFGLQLNVATSMGEADGTIIDSIVLLQVVYIGSNWMFIREGESLRLLIDGKKFSFTASYGLRDRDVIAGGNVREKMPFVASLSDIVRIAQATEVRVKVYGDKSNQEGSFSEKNFKAFKEFTNKYLTVQP
jgi:hypothetical protein